MDHFSSVVDIKQPQILHFQFHAYLLFSQYNGMKVGEEMSQNLYTSIRGFRVWYKADYEKRDAITFESYQSVCSFL